jgi:hypothetical protein
MRRRRKEYRKGVDGAEHTQDEEAVERARERPSKIGKELSKIRKELGKAGVGIDKKTYTTNKETMKKTNTNMILSRHWRWPDGDWELNQSRELEEGQK